MKKLSSNKVKRGVHFKISEEAYNKLCNSSEILDTNLTKIVENSIQETHEQVKLIERLEKGEELNSNELNSIYKFIFWYGGTLKASRKKELGNTLLNKLESLGTESTEIESLKALLN